MLRITVVGDKRRDTVCLNVAIVSGLMGSESERQLLDLEYLIDRWNDRIVEYVKQNPCLLSQLPNFVGSFIIAFDSYYKNCLGKWLVEDVRPILFYEGKSPLDRHFEEDYPECTLSSEHKDPETILGQNYQPITIEGNLDYVSKKIDEIADELTIFAFQNPPPTHDLIVSFYVIFSQYYEEVAEKDLLGCLRDRFEDGPERRTNDQTNQDQSEAIDPLPEILIVDDENQSETDREWQSNENRMAQRYRCTRLPRSLRQGPSDCRINYDFEIDENDKLVPRSDCSDSE